MDEGPLAAGVRMHGGPWSRYYRTNEAASVQ